METNKEKKSTYSASHKAYYEKNKEKAKTYQQEKKPYKAYYEKNKEELNRKRLERYYAAKALKAQKTPDSSPDSTPASPDSVEV